MTPNDFSIPFICMKQHGFTEGVNRERSNKLSSLATSPIKSLTSREEVTDTKGHSGMSATTPITSTVTTTTALTSTVSSSSLVKAVSSLVAASSSTVSVLSTSSQGIVFPLRPQEISPLFWTVYENTNQMYSSLFVQIHHQTKAALNPYYVNARTAGAIKSNSTWLTAMTARLVRSI